MWADIRRKIAVAALSKCGVVSASDGARPEDMALALAALDRVVNTLLADGLTFPLSKPSLTAMSWIAGDPAPFIGDPVDERRMPEDFESLVGVLCEVQGGQPRELLQMDHAQWDLRDPEEEGDPYWYYLASSGQVYVHPVPADDGEGHLRYRGTPIEGNIDAAARFTTNWESALIYGVASDISEDYAVPPQTMQRLDGKYAYYKGQALRKSAPDRPIRLSAARRPRR